jgi:FtsP/CotA-like multicopper oxidase with cupredoxin domain
MRSPCVAARLRRMLGLSAFFILLSSLSSAVLAASYTLFIQSGTHTVNGAGGTTLKVWGYTTGSGAPPMVPGPILEAREGEAVTVTVYNNHNKSHNFLIKGVTSDTTAIPAGGNRTYSFTPTKGGVYMYYDTLASNVNREMGMFGALIVRPADGSNRAWGSGPGYDIERLWVISDMDKPRWNDVAGNNGTVSTGTYKPNFFMMNGLGGFDGMHDPNSVLQGAAGQTGLVRIVNAGQLDESLHFHANHFRIIDVDGARLSSPEYGDTINVKAGTTAMVLFQLKSGIFPMHVHTAQMETANGVYLNGVATLLVGN